MISYEVIPINKERCTKELNITKEDEQQQRKLDFSISSILDDMTCK